ncbi:MAG: hypothetical protein R3F17_01960 [Planctomycetota bacterium]
MKPLRCTVRGCEAALQREGQVYRCERGHSFDVARAGYVNLLQPTDKRSQAPGDSAEAVAARVRLLELGVDAELVAASLEWLAGLGLHGGSRLADVGAGIGTWLGAWSAAGEYEAFGVDLSSRCAEAAAKRHKMRRGWWRTRTMDCRSRTGRWMCCCR